MGENEIENENELHVVSDAVTEGGRVPLKTDSMRQSGRSAPKHDPGLAFAEKEDRERFKSAEEGDTVSFWIRDPSGQSISGSGVIEKIFQNKRKRAIHLTLEDGTKQVLTDPSELTVLIKREVMEADSRARELEREEKKRAEIESIVASGKPDVQPILPGTIDLDMAFDEMVMRRSTWDDAVGELEAHEAFLDEHKRKSKELKSAVKEARKLFLAAKRTVKNLGGETK